MAEFKLGRLKFVWKGDWAAAATFVKDDIVKYGGKSYVCVFGHTSATDFYDDLGTNYWEEMTDGFMWRGEFNDGIPPGNLSPTPGGIKYNLNDVVSFGGGTYICTTQHTSGQHFDETKWEAFVKGFEYEDSWSTSVEYQIGDVVSYGGYTYKALTRNTNKTPTQFGSDWIPFLEGTHHAGTWSDLVAYRTGDIVMYGGNTYICIKDTAAGDTPENTGLELIDYQWQLFSEGFSWKGNWADTTHYAIGDIVKQSTNSYICIAHHTADEGVNDPLSDTNNDYWNALADGSALTTLTTKGDILFRDATGNARLPIGTTNQLLITKANGEPGWSSTAAISATSLTTTGNIITESSIVIDDAGDGGELYVGDGAYDLTQDNIGAGYVGYTDAKAVFSNNVNAFAQIALKNKNSGEFASTDFIVYTDEGDNDSGWMDMGITSSSFDITSGYGITGKHDGYIFMSAPAGTVGTGNLVIATGENGSERDIVFVTAGFDPNTNPEGEKLRIIGQDTVAAAFTASCSGTTMTVTAISDGAILFDGTGAGIGGTGVEPGTRILSQLSGTAGGTGTYQLDQKQTWSSRSITQYARRAGVEVKITSESNNPGSGALRVEGGIGLLGNMNVEGEIVAYGGAIYQGRDGGVTAKQLTEDDSVFAGYVGLTNASGIFTGDADDFVQFALKNHSSGTSASTDIIAYASDGDNDSGWIDMGITSANYDDPAFTVTGPDTGYIFMSAPAGTANNGDLLVGTDSTGVHNDIVIFSNGFDGGNERMRIVGAARAGHALGVEILAPTESTSTDTGALRVNGGIGLVGNMNVGGDVNIVGTITVGGAGSALETTTLAVSDPMIIMGTGNTTDAIDLGFYGVYDSSGTKYAGLVRDASDNTFKLFSGLATQPGSTVDFTSNPWAALTVGALTSNANTSLGAAGSTITLAASTGTINIGGTSASTATINVYSDLLLSSGKVVKIGAAEVLAKSKLTLNGSSSGTVAFQAAAAAGSTTYTLPSADGSANFVLGTNGSGTLSWATPATTVSDDTSTNTTYYPTFSTASSGILTAGVKVSSSKLTYNPSTGTLTSTILTASSDERLKENVKPLENALEKVLQLEGVEFNRIGQTAKEIGVIAQRVEAIVPELVTTGEDGMKSVAYGNTVALLIEAIKQQQAEIDELKKRLG